MGNILYFIIDGFNAMWPHPKELQHKELDAEFITMPEEPPPPHEIQPDELQSDELQSDELPPVPPKLERSDTQSYYNIYDVVDRDEGHQEIKKYVEETFGLKSSPVPIPSVKRKRKRKRSYR